jgi:hypothetical protein
MLKTAIYAYEPMRGKDITVADTTLSPATSKSTFHESDRPASAFKLNEEYNASVIIFENYDTTPNINSAVNIWGYGKTGPAEFIAELSLTTGAARIDDEAGDLYTDTITRVNDLSDGHIKKIKITDSGNDRVAKVWFDNVGYKYLYVEVYDLTTGAKINPMIRPW